MSTRGACGFRVGGIDKITYNHSDSYPAGLGEDVLRFLRDELRVGTDGKPDPAAEEALRQRANAMELVDANSKATPEQIERYRDLGDTGVGSRDLTDWYVLLRGAQGDLRAYLHRGIMPDNQAFLYDSLFCEFAYIVNLDDRVLEVYVGFQKKVGKGRYAEVPERHRDRETEYQGVTLAKAYSFDKLPKRLDENVIRKAAGRDA